MHRYPRPFGLRAGLEASPVIPGYFLGRPSRVYVARFRRRNAAAASDPR